MLDQLFGAAVQKSDMRIDALDDLAIELEYQPQYAMGRRVLGPEIDGEIAHSRLRPWRPRVGCRFNAGRQHQFQLHPAPTSARAPREMFNSGVAADEVPSRRVDSRLRRQKLAR